jgi:cobalt/nickel transport system ATP-binding protein
VIRAENLTVKYGPDNALPALDAVSFSVAPGERAALLGQNGAGKSTLLLALAGVLTPVSGAAFIGGVPVEKRRLPEIRRLAGYVFQNPDDQLFMPTVREDMGFGPRNFGVDEETLASKTAAVAETLRITHLLDRPAGRLSGGEKRLAALAGVLVMDCRLLLLDEPCAFLDAASRRRLIAVLAALPHTMLIATHDLPLVRALCSRVIILREGRVVASGPAESLLDDTALLEEWGL